MDPASSWSMRGVDTSGHPTVQSPFVGGRIWAYEYSLTGAVTGAPRRVKTWSDGEAIRAMDGRTLLIAVDAGMVIRSPDADPRVVHQGIGELYTPPFPEIEALRSLRDACAWVDEPLPSSPPTELIHLEREALRYVGPRLQVIVDGELGFVLRIERVGEHGILVLAGLRCSWVEAWPGVFADDLLPAPR